MKELKPWYETFIGSYELDFTDDSWGITIDKVSGSKYRICVHSQLSSMNKQLKMIDNYALYDDINEAKLQVELFIEKVKQFEAFL